MRKLVLCLNYLIIFFLVRKIYSSENKDNFDLEIIDYKENISLDHETIEKLKCGFHFSSITDIQALKSNLIEPSHSNPWITIVLIKVTNEEEVKKFKDDFEIFFNNFIVINEAPQK